MKIKLKLTMPDACEGYYSDGFMNKYKDAINSEIIFEFDSWKELNEFCSSVSEEADNAFVCPHDWIWPAIRYYPNDEGIRMIISYDYNY